MASSENWECNDQTIISSLMHLSVFPPTHLPEGEWLDCPGELDNFESLVSYSLPISQTIVSKIPSLVY